MATLPVFLFTGFLEGGKTTFLQDTLQNPNFQDGDTTLVILCEEGEVELDTSKIKGHIYIKTLEEQSQLTPEYLESCYRGTKAERIIIEYNGMWLLQDLINALPKGWQIYQVLTLLDATTYPMYLANMRNLVLDKFALAEMIAINRCEKDFDKLSFHKDVRAVNRRAEIIYEYKDGEIAYDDIEDPLPFDLEANPVIIADEDFGLFFMDIMDDPSKYDGKTLKFKGLAATQRLPKDTFIAGRFCMTCCVEDIAYQGLVCDYKQAASLGNRGWYMVTAKVKVKKHRLYTGPGPVLEVITANPTSKPEEEVVYFR